MFEMNSVLDQAIQIAVVRAEKGNGCGEYPLTITGQNVIAEFLEEARSYQIFLEKDSSLFFIGVYNV